MNVATHPVAQLSFRVIPDAQSLQHPHRSRPPRTHTFHTIYDNNGSMTSRDDSNSFVSFDHDTDGRFSYAIKLGIYGFESMSYGYDALGRRVHRGEMYGPTTSFTYDGDDVLLSNTNSAVTTFQNGTGIDNNLSTNSGGSSSYVHRDHLGTPLASSTTAGVLSGGSTITDSFGFGVSGFTGREYDSYTDLQYSRARMYDPKLGRFISEDPIGFAGGDVNLYGYVRNMPLWYRDPHGLQPGADVVSQPSFWQGVATGVAVVSPYVPPVAVAAGGAAAIYGATYVGEYTANHPYNPFVQGPWPLNPYKPPFGYPAPVYPTPISPTQPYCEPRPRAIPFERAPTIPQCPILHQTMGMDVTLNLPQTTQSANPSQIRASALDVGRVRMSGTGRVELGVGSSLR